jgi:hypothetical protein
MLDEYLRNRPAAGTGDVERDLGHTPAKTVGMASWAAHMERKKAGKPARKIKERPLTDSMAKCRPDERAVDPCERVDNRDQLFRAIFENAVPDTRGQMNRLSLDEREILLNHILSNIGADVFDGLDRERALTIALEITQSWLEVREQERRENGRKDRNR